MSVSSDLIQMLSPFKLDQDRREVPNSDTSQITCRYLLTSMFPSELSGPSNDGWFTAALIQFSERPMEPWSYISHLLLFHGCQLSQGSRLSETQVLLWSLDKFRLKDWDIDILGDLGTKDKTLLLLHCELSKLLQATLDTTLHCLIFFFQGKFHFNFQIFLNFGTQLSFDIISLGPPFLTSLSLLCEFVLLFSYLVPNIQLFAKVHWQVGNS